VPTCLHFPEFSSLYISNYGGPQRIFCPDEEGGCEVVVSCQYLWKVDARSHSMLHIWLILLVCRNSQACRAAQSFPDSPSAAPVPGSGMCFTPPWVGLASPACHLQQQNLMQWETDTQKCIDTNLKTIFLTKPNTWFVVFAESRGINTFMVADFKLPMWCHWAGSWEEINAIGSCKLVRESFHTPLLTWRYNMWLWFPPCPGSHPPDDYLPFLTLALQPWSHRVKYKDTSFIETI
jgi:hypothetical protein